MAAERTEYLLVGDHLGQVKKVLLPSNEISILTGCASPSSSNPVVSIEPIGKQSSRRQLIANRNGELYVYDCIHGEIKSCRKSADDALNKALPISKEKVFLIYDKKVTLDAKQGGDSVFANQKRGQIKNSTIHDGKLAYVGMDIPLKIFDIEKKNKIFEADPPEKDWLGIKPDVYVAGLDFVGRTRVATCSKSDSVIRIYDTLGKAKPIISVDLNQTAFNEHADSARFISVASTGDDGHTVVVGSNVGQILAIDLRFNVKQLPKKKLQPRNHKVLGGFKGARGASIKDLKIVPGLAEQRKEDDDDDDYDEDDETDQIVSAKEGHRVVSCCLDRYLRIHNFTKNSRQLDRHIYMTTKPLCFQAISASD